MCHQWTLWMTVNPEFTGETDCIGCGTCRSILECTQVMNNLQ